MIKKLKMMLFALSLALPVSAAEIYHDTWIDFNKNGTMDIYENRSEPIEKRVEDLLSQMTSDEKTVQLCTLYGYKRVLEDALPNDGWLNKIWKDGIANIDEQHNGISNTEYAWPASKHSQTINDTQRWFIEKTRLGIPVDFTNEGIRGVCHVYATNFPCQIAIGATWNRQLVNEIGKVTGKEAAALGYTHLYSPILDVPRDQRWGRVVECYGESPYLVAQLGIEQANGIRSAGPGVTCKHFAVYSIPNGGRDGDCRTDPHVAPREMELIHLYAFEQVLANADITGVMSSYNDWNGVPISASSQFMIDILRKRMGFTGYVVSDSDAVEQIHHKHRIAPNFKEAARLYLEKGGNVRTNFSKPEDFINLIRESLNEGKLSMDVIDARVRDVLAVKFKLGLFDKPYVDAVAADAIVASDEHRAIALKAAQESLVLLKNQDNTLPLDLNKVKRIAVVGPGAVEKEVCWCRYGPKKGNVISVLEGIKQACSENIEVVYSKGCNHHEKSWPVNEIIYTEIASEEINLIEAAVEAAGDCEYIIAVVGESEDMVGECKSRTSLDLPQNQQLLLRKLHATGKPVIVVLLNGRPLSINWEDKYCPAILDAWFGGEFMGQAVADAIFGKYNPGGKLPITFPRTAGQIPINFPVHNAALGKQSSGNNPNGTGNTRVTESLYPFGYGLSYTTFKYSDLKLSSDKITATDTVTVSLTVTNEGKYAGDEIVQLYVRDRYASVIPYDKDIRGFERIHLAAGESKQVSFTLEPTRDFWLIDANLDRVVEPGDFEIMIGASSADTRLKKNLSVTGDTYIVSTSLLK